MPTVDQKNEMRAIGCRFEAKLAPLVFETISTNPVPIAVPAIAMVFAGQLACLARMDKDARSAQELLERLLSLLCNTAQGAFEVTAPDDDTRVQ